MLVRREERRFRFRPIDRRSATASHHTLRKLIEAHLLFLKIFCNSSRRTEWSEWDSSIQSTVNLLSIHLNFGVLSPICPFPNKVNSRLTKKFEPVIPRDQQRESGIFNPSSAAFFCMAAILARHKCPHVVSNTQRRRRQQQQESGRPMDGRMATILQ